MNFPFEGHCAMTNADEANEVQENAVTAKKGKKRSINAVDRKWGLWLIDLGNFRKLRQFSFLNLNLAEKPKNKRKKYKN